MPPVLAVEFRAKRRRFITSPCRGGKVGHLMQRATAIFESHQPEAPSAASRQDIDLELQPERREKQVLAERPRAFRRDRVQADVDKRCESTQEENGASSAIQSPAGLC